MPSSHEAAGRSWVALGPRAWLELLRPLADEHARHGKVQLIAGEPSPDLIARVARTHAAECATFLVLEDPAQPSLRTQYVAPWLHGTNILLGWLRLAVRELESYAHRAAALLRRIQPEPSLILLGPREQRYRVLLDQLEHEAQAAANLTAFRWSAERIRRAPLIAALRCGPGATLYTGHGSAAGWFAYAGLRPQTFFGDEAWSSAESSALLFSLSCHTGQPAAPLQSHAFADALVAGGVAGCVVAPWSDSLHTDNCGLARGLIHALGRGSQSLHDILVGAASTGAALHDYAVIGDPGMLALASPHAAYRARRVFAPAQDADLGAFAATQRR
jgi:hypothetical protein